MLRKIIIALGIFICFVLQTTLFKFLALGNIAPNLLLMLTFFAGFIRGKKEGVYVGFFSGLLIDICYGRVIGFNALLLMYIGFLNGAFNKMYYDDEVTLPMGLVCISDFIYNFIFYVFQFLLRARLSFGYYLIHIIIPEMVYTVIITFVFYKLFLKINSTIEKYEKGSASSFD